MLPVWGLGIRPIPKLDAPDAKNIFVIAVLHTIGHFGAVVSMSLGAVSFTHIVKAAEPVFSTVFTGLLLGKWAPWQVSGHAWVDVPTLTTMLGMLGRGALGRSNATYDACLV